MIGSKPLISVNKLFLTSLTTAFYLACQHPSLAQGQELLVNSNFSEWSNGTPVDWKVSVGATNGRGKGAKSIIKQGVGPSLELSGDRNVEVWRLVSQEIPVKPNQSYVFKVTAVTTGLKREATQFDNCHVNYVLKDQRWRGQVQKFFSLQSSKETINWISIKTRPNTKTIEVGFFLSKTGKLNIKQASIEEASISNSFELLVADMDRNYSYFDHKNVDWKGLTDRYRERAKNAANVEDFKDVILTMLAEIDDNHIWVNHGYEKFLRKSTNKNFRPNFDFAIVDSDLVEKSRIGEFAVVGKTKEGFGYVRIVSLTGFGQDNLNSLVAKIEQLFETPGIILDLRRNRGGAEPIAAKIASMFVDKQQVYGRSLFRSGPRHDQFYESQKRKIGPRKNGDIYRGPIVCMIGPGAVSSAEGFAMMMSAIERCKMIGQPTRGSTGNPAAVHLVDNIEVYYSRWISMMPDGTPIEDNGVPVDEAIAHVSGSDKTFARAVEILESATR